MKVQDEINLHNQKKKVVNANHLGLIDMSYDQKKGWESNWELSLLVVITCFFFFFFFWLVGLH
jgi:hypothetical protein